MHVQWPLLLTRIFTLAVCLLLQQLSYLRAAGAVGSSVYRWGDRIRGPCAPALRNLQVHSTTAWVLLLEGTTSGVLLLGYYY